MAPRDEKIAQTVDDIQFFSDVDKKYEKTKATLTASYPAWYFDQQLADKKEELASRTRKRDPDEIVDIDPEYLAETKALSSRIKEIEASRPKLNGAQQNYLKKVTSDLESNIAASMFPYDDMHTGAASPHEELKRQTMPCIPIDKRLAASLGIETKRGMASRDDATRAMQICNKLMGEDSNAEKLRRKVQTCRTSRVTPFIGDGDGPSFGEMMEVSVGRETATEATP